MYLLSKYFSFVILNQDGQFKHKSGSSLKKKAHTNPYFLSTMLKTKYFPYYQQMLDVPHDVT